MSFLKDTLNNYTTKASDSFNAEANVSLDSCSILIHEDGIQEPCIISPSSCSSDSFLYSSTPSPSCTISLPPSLPEGSATQPQAPSVAGSALLSTTGMPPVSSCGTTTVTKKRKRNDMSDIEDDCREALRNLKQTPQENDDFSASFGRAVGHWMRDLPAGERTSAAFKIMEVMKSHDFC
ncbi:uncharacterized protein LOC126992683 [Eriocheir sinensis]|uniref:uncharacterized protein LOC126992683 n=1 Tax=Eriocheir sinensis TaxID=95602 RepID=UPI0021C6BFF4|nr:uncharacterized protein LOC126992683 [Eriocheir sinensis]